MREKRNEEGYPRSSARKEESSVGCSDEVRRVFFYDGAMRGELQSERRTRQL
jgi:hypothetical protein